MTYRYETAKITKRPVPTTTFTVVPTAESRFSRANVECVALSLDDAVALMSWSAQALLHAGPHQKPPTLTDAHRTPRRKADTRLVGAS
jgi:alkyl hydroperoxide reductase subunit AhpC